MKFLVLDTAILKRLSAVLFVQDGGTRFEVNLEALRRQHLRASPQLLKHSQTGPVR